MAVRRNVFTIPTGAPFLDTLVAGLLDRSLVRNFDPRDPFALADVTIYLPTRRAARAIRESFLGHFGRPVLLPKIRTLGDLDEEDLVFEGADASNLPPAISVMERQLVLTKLVLAWSGALVRAAADLPDEELIVPASPADAARLASSLGSLIDQVGTDEAAWSGLFSGIPADLARYWQITLEFLKIATVAWPNHLAERGLVDPGWRRDRMIRDEAARLLARGSAGPVIAAGSTGSVPATAALLAAIARLPNGAVVLPGLDQTLDAESWDEIGPSDREPAGSAHPQHGLKKLLEALGIQRTDVQAFGTSTTETRARFVSEAMRPAGTTHRWSENPVLSAAVKRETLQAVGIVNAANEREEALAVATLLREAVETPGRIAALVTPDRGLGRRVAVELKRWGIDVDDSGGRPLTKTPPGILARLVAEVALGDGRAETLLALLKHPLAAFGLPQAEARGAARALERGILRGPRLRPGLAALRHAIENAAQERKLAAQEGDRPRFSTAAASLRPEDWDAAEDLVRRLQTALAPLDGHTTRRTVACIELVEAHLAALLAVAGDEKSGTSIAVDEAGRSLLHILEDLRSSAAAGPDVAPRDYPGLFAALIERGVVHRRGGVDPRIHIWGTLEARLQSVDLVVLGGMNEGSWPAQTRLDPLLSRPMRAALSLEPPERRIGLAAHDFTQALGHRAVWITRADRQDGEPKVASRWVQRLTALAGGDLADGLAARGAEILRRARLLDAPQRTDPAQRPHPSPPLHLRPKKLSVTQIETLIRDPYAIYARHVLKLRPFEPLAKLPDAAERGTLIHTILEALIRERPRGPFDRQAQERLLAIGREHFAAYADFPEIATLWWPRFERIARWFIGTEAERSDVVERLVEGTGRMQVAPEFQLSARADRLDRLQDGRLVIVDYKTGAPPSADEVLSLSPQMPLEALIAQAGGFEAVGSVDVARLEYFHISGRGEGGSICERGTRDKAKPGKPALTLPEALLLTETRLQELVADYARPEAEYLSRKIPRTGRDFAGDYDHLARVAEWSVADAAEGS